CSSDLCHCRPRNRAAAGTGTRSAGSCADHPFMRDRQLFDDDLVGTGVQIRALPVGGPAVLEVPAGGLGAHRVVDHQRAVAAGAVDVAIEDNLAPLPERLGGVQAALQGDVSPLRGAGDLPDQELATLGGLPVLDHVGLRVDAGGLLELSDGDTVDLDEEGGGGQQVRHSSLPLGMRLLRLVRHYSTPGPAHWPMRMTTNSAGFTAATPISMVTRPSSTDSRGLVSASHFT